MTLKISLAQTIFSCLVLLSLSFGCPISASAQQLDHVLGELLIVPHSSLSIDQLRSQYQTFHGTPTQLQVRPLGHLNGTSVWHLTFDYTQVHEGAFFQALQQETRILEIQYNHLLKSRILPDDPLLVNQWNILNPGAPGLNSEVQTQFPELWDQTTGGTNLNGDTIVVAIIDDGSDVDHPDLIHNHWRNYGEIPGNGYDDDNNGYVDDYLGWNVSAGIDLVQYGSHGVQVAGVLGAKGNNGTGITGTNWNIKLMHVAGVSLTEDELMAAYFYVGEWRQRYNQTNGTQGAFVTATNTSMGIDGGNPNDMPIWCALYNLLGEEGILSAVAASNNDVNVDEVGDLPTTCSSEYIIAVTATDPYDKREFAAYGPTHVDLAAPGASIWTTAAGGNYESVTGTSFAAPQVAGLIGLLYASDCEHLTTLSLNAPAEAALLIKDAILSGVDLVPSLSEETLSGGRLNAWESYLKLNQLCAECPEANNVSAYPVDEHNALIDWSVLGDVQFLDLQYRTGGGSWITLNTVEPPYLLEDLESCTEYEYRIISICADNEQISDIHQFTTEGCCISPPISNIEGIAPNTVELSWPSISNAVGYLVRYRIIGAQNWTVQSSPCNCAYIDNLTPCEDYEFEIKTLCNNTNTNFGPTYNFTTGGCSNCTTLPYCNSYGLESMLEWIETIEIPAMNYVNHSGNNQGYGSFSDPVIPVEIGSNVEIHLSPGYEFFNYEELVRIWVDLNHDGYFSSNELLAQPAQAITGPTTVSFNIPGFATPGITRMRILMQWNDGWSAPQACGYYDFGETEDYCIQLVESCSNDYLPTTIQNGPTAMFISWNSPDYFQQHRLRYRLFNSSMWTEVQVSGQEWTLEGLTPCQDYEYQMAPICAEGLGSWSVSHFFTTDCSNPNGTQAPWLAQTRVWPNPFAETLTIQGFLAGSKADLQAQLFTERGQLVEEWRISSLDLEKGFQKNLPAELAPGIYWLELSQGQQRQMFPLVHL